MTDKTSSYGNTNGPNCFKGFNYASPKGRIIEDIRILERGIERLEAEKNELKNKIKELEEKLANERESFEIALSNAEAGHQRDLEAKIEQRIKELNFNL